MVSAKKIIDSYASFLSKHPLTVILLVCALLFLSSITSGWIENKTINYATMLPDEVEVIKANNIFTDSFGSSDSARFVLEVDPLSVNSNEIRDIRDPAVFEYAEKLILFAEESREVEEVNSANNLLKQINDGQLPKDKLVIINSMEQNPLLYNYISSDYEMMIIDVSLRENYDSEELVYDLESAIESVPKIPGIKVSLGGDSVAEVYVDKELTPDMARTSMFSIVGIVVVLFLIFGSIKYGFLPLTTIIVGIYLTMGFVGLAGIPMSSMTNGVISMIMGIGIDFGIQIITRFRQELRKNSIEKSMQETLENTLWPMFTTTLAAIIGFQSMSLGQITILADMGNIMMYGVIFCFLTAITFVPAITVIVETLFSSIKKKKTKRRSKK